jgi:hypothetical protein
MGGSRKTLPRTDDTRAVRGDHPGVLPTRLEEQDQVSLATRPESASSRITRLLDLLCWWFGHRWTPWERPVRLIETCSCDRCGMTRTRRLGLV